MRLAVQQSYALLERYGCYVTEACDKCGQILGPVRYTWKGHSGVWCSGNAVTGPKRTNQEPVSTARQDSLKRSAAGLLFATTPAGKRLAERMISRT